jgi:hypothetical protein
MGQPQSLSIPDLLEKDFVGKQPRRESLLACSGNTRTTMLQINEPLPERRYADGDIAYYVIGGISMGFMAGHPNLTPSTKDAFDGMKEKLKDNTGKDLGGPDEKEVK